MSKSSQERAIEQMNGTNEQLNIEQLHGTGEKDVEI